MILQNKIASGGVIVLDGATGTEIARLGVQMDSAAWCAVANKTHPDIVRLVHEEYIRAGADVITTNTFATCRHVLAGAGLAEEAVSINRCAVELARQACDNVAPARPIAVAGSMSNTVAWQEGTISADPRYLPTPAQEAANYREMADTLAETGVDLLILEMMLDIEHASRAMEAAVATGLPVWVGISCSQRDNGTMVGWDMAKEARVAKDQALPDPLPLVDIVKALHAIGGQVFGIMHSSVSATSPGLEVLFEHWDGPVMAYPEMVVFDYDTHRPSVTMSSAKFAGECRDWVGRGVQIIGGCCGTTIEHIRQMIDQLPSVVGSRKATSVNNALTDRAKSTNRVQPGILDNEQ